MSAKSRVRMWWDGLVTRYGLRAWLLVLVQVVVTLVILELGTRGLLAIKAYLDRDLPPCYTYTTVRCKPTTFNQEFGEVISFSGEAAIRTIPNYRGEWVTTNALGFRGTRETTVEKTSGTLRVVVMGASGMWGAYVHDDETIPVYLEQELSQTLNQPVEVINAAIPGSISFQELVHLQAAVLPLKPDVVVIYDGRNDLYFSNSAKWSPTLTVASTNAAETVRQLEVGNPAIISNQFWRLGIKYSKFLSTIDTLYGVVRARQQEQAIASVTEPVHPEAVAVYQQNLKLMAASLKAEQIPAIFVLQPILQASSKPIHPEEQVIIDRAGQTYQNTVALYPQAQAVNQILGQQDGLAAFDYVDMFADLTDRMYVDEVHPTAAGNQIIARRLAQDILAVLAAQQ